MINVFFVSGLINNFIFISKFIQENNCLIIFFFTGFVIQDLVISAVVGVGRCENGFYVFNRVYVNFLFSVGFCNNRVISVIWYVRLGYFFISILFFLNKYGDILFFNKNNFYIDFCFGC